MLNQRRSLMYLTKTMITDAGYEVHSNGVIIGRRFNKPLRQYRGGSLKYLQVGLCIDGYVYNVLVSRLVAWFHTEGTPEQYEHLKDFDVDHKDHDLDNNDISNLRLCSRSQNQWNRIPGRGSSKYKGVCQRSNGNMWQAFIGLNNKRIFLGSFEDEVEAAIAYNNAAIKYFGEYARINDVSK